MFGHGLSEVLAAAVTWHPVQMEMIYPVLLTDAARPSVQAQVEEMCRHASGHGISPCCEDQQ